MCVTCHTECVYQD